MKLDKGLSTDTKEIDQPQGFIRHGKNGVYDTHFSYKNEPGFLPSSSNIPYTPIGVIELDKDVVIFSTDNTNCAIGIYEDATDKYTSIVDRNDLGFNLDYPITGEFERNYRGEIVIVFTDNNTFPKYANLSDPPVTLDAWKLFPEGSLPIIDNMRVNDTGGSFMTGQYFFGMFYTDSDGTQTNVTPLSRGINVSDDNISEGFDKFDGAPTGTLSSKSVTLDISNIDSKYDNLKIVQVSQINGVTSSKVVATLPTSSSTYSATITGGETSEDISIEEVLIPNQSFKTVKTFTQVNSRLYLANVTVDKDIDYQAYANKIQVKYCQLPMELTSLDETKADPWKAINQPINNWVASHKVGTPRTFMPGEVYALYIRFIRRNGTRTQAYHIPGREANLYDRTNKEFTPAIEGPAFRVQPTSSKSDNTIGELGFWENENEIYPDNFPELAGQKVRHHRMPSIKRLREDHYDSSAVFGTKQLALLGLEVSNIRITDEIASQCEGFEILYAKRDTVNSTVVTSDLMLFGGKDNYGPEEGDIITTTGGNWSMERVYAGDSHEGIYIDPYHLRLHSFDLMYEKLQVNPTYVEQALKLKRKWLDEWYEAPFFTGGKIEASGDGKGQRWREIVDYSDGTAEASTSREALKDIQNLRYIPTGLESGEIYNIGAEETALVRIVEGNEWLSKMYGGGIHLTAITFSSNADNDNSVNFDPVVEDTEESALLVLYQLKSDIYNSFKTQELVSTGKVYKIEDTTWQTVQVFGGDSFASTHSFVTMGQRYIDDDDITLDGTRTVRRFSGYFNNYPDFRHVDVTDSLSQYYPMVDPDTLTELMASDQNPNHIAYNKDYSKLNDFVESSVYDPDIKFETRFPYLIARSKISTREQQKEISWRTFLANEYFEAVKNKGEITNIQGKGTNLIIHHEYSMFVTRDKTTLKGDILDITLGSGDIFELPPEEVTDDNKGYAGLQNQLAALLCRHGYIFIDSLEGKIFLYNESLHDITNSMRLFFRDKFTTEDNSYIGNGITLTYDKNFDRLLVGVKNNRLRDSVKYKGVFINTTEFVESLNPGDIVLMNGQYKVFKG